MHLGRYIYASTAAHMLHTYPTHSLHMWAWAKGTKPNTLVRSSCSSTGVAPTASRAVAPTALLRNRRGFDPLQLGTLKWGLWGVAAPRPTCPKQPAPNYSKNCPSKKLNMCNYPAIREPTKEPRGHTATLLDAASWASPPAPIKQKTVSPQEPH